MSRKVALIDKATLGCDIPGGHPELQKSSRARHPKRELVRVRRQSVAPLERAQDLKATQRCFLRASGQIDAGAILVKTISDALFGNTSERKSLGGSISAITYNTQPRRAGNTSIRGGIDA
jgi:hypothetical protein